MTRSPEITAGEAKVSMQVHQQVVNMLSAPDWLPTLQHVHPSLKSFFPITEMTSPLAGRIQKFLANWKMITKDRVILDIVKGWDINL